MTRTRRTIAPMLLGTCLLAAPFVPLATAQERPMGTPPPATDTARARDDGDADFGWIGLLGLIGLAGLMRNRRAEQYGGRTATATR
jgi:hypothetical protein